MPHIHEKYDFVIAAYVVFNGRALLVYHPRYEMWTPVGGHVELDEDPEQTLIREVREEAGLEVDFLNTKPKIVFPGTKYIHAPQYIDVHEANPPHKHIALTYFLRAKSGDSVKSDEHTQMRWFSLEELEDESDQFNAPVKFYAKEAIKLAASA
jgi:8-oxo-dGTP diphosphatase